MSEPPDVEGNPASGAVFSPCRTYRYRLWRRWDDGPSVAFLMLNPSTADAVESDPTIRRCRGYAEAWGFGALLVGNLFALRSPDPAALSSHPEPVGPANEEHLRAIVTQAGETVAAWGHRGGLGDRGPEVADILDTTLLALDTTKDGHPVHPLYQPAGKTPTSFAYEGDEGSTR